MRGVCGVLMDNIIRVFIGHDSRAPHHTDVCRQSILRHTDAPVLIELLDMDALRRASMYRRWHYLGEDGAQVDGQDGRPFSSEFAFTRFLVPALTQWQGHAIFCDSDFMFKDDIAELWKARREDKAVQVAKQHYVSSKTRKKGGAIQENYTRKNWSSLILWNNAHHANSALTTYTVNTFPGNWLHTFSWLEDDQIGHLDLGWNWIEGTTQAVPRAVHFTLGVPDLEECRNAKYADEWLDYLEY